MWETRSLTCRVDRRVSQTAAAGQTEFIVKLPSSWMLNKRVPHCSADWCESRWRGLCPDNMNPQEQSANCSVCSSCQRVHHVCAEGLFDVHGHCRHKAPVKSYSKNPHYFIAWGLNLSSWQLTVQFTIFIITVPGATPLVACTHSITTLQV